MLINVSEGTLRGEKLKSDLTSREFYSFKGIPFAKPPVGPLRFKSPVPPDKYEGVWDATQERSMCIQSILSEPGSIYGDEDCLYLNVFTPKLPGEGEPLKPVMFYIYGGGFSEGRKDSCTYGPDYLVPKDVVLVIPNYRLNVFGFLNLGIEECSGNCGLKDIVAALKWTEQNISHFGGDPNNITIFGHSSGATSVMYLLYSPLLRGKGLFHRAIVQSGRCVDPSTAETSVDRISRAAKKLGFESKDPHELYSFLMEAPASDLVHNAFDVLTQEDRYNGEAFPYVLSAEVAGPTSERLIVATTFTELIKVDLGVPIMIGVCTHDAAMALHESINEKRPTADFVSRVESAIVPCLFKDLIKDEETKKKVIDKFHTFYFHGKSTYEEIVGGAIDLFSDVVYVRDFHDYVKALLTHSSQAVHRYLFSFHAHIGELYYYLKGDKSAYFKGAGHADELGYLFNQRRYSLGEPDRKIVEFLSTLWTNFAKYSNPGEGLPIDFKPATAGNNAYLEINEELVMKQGVIFEERMKFIDDVHMSLTSE